MSEMNDESRASGASGATDPRADLADWLGDIVPGADAAASIAPPEGGDDAYEAGGGGGGMSGGSLGGIGAASTGGEGMGDTNAAAGGDAETGVAHLREDAADGAGSGAGTQGDTTI